MCIRDDTDLKLFTPMHSLLQEIGLQKNRKLACHNMLANLQCKQVNDFRPQVLHTGISITYSILISQGCEQSQVVLLTLLLLLYYYLFITVLVVGQTMAALLFKVQNQEGWCCYPLNDEMAWRSQVVQRTTILLSSAKTIAHTYAIN